MNLAEIRLQILDNLGTSIKVSHNHLARLINRAVEHLVNVVEQTGQIWNAADLGKSISVVSGTLEYQIVASDIRKILQVERTDLSGGNVRCIIIPWRDKNRYQNRSIWGSGSCGSRPAVYIRRNSAGEWYLGFPADPSTTMTLKVYYAPLITDLSGSADEPTEIPAQYHELVVLRATIMLLAQNKQDSSFWQAAYNEQLQLMQADLERWNRTGPRVKQFHVSEK